MKESVNNMNSTKKIDSELVSEFLTQINIDKEIKDLNIVEELDNNSDFELIYEGNI
jgi:hypothetical protein